MAENSGGKKDFILSWAILLVAVIGLAYMAFAPSEQADIKIGLSDGIKIETD